jgi:hypothetical protein
MMDDHKVNLRGDNKVEDLRDSQKVKNVTTL